MLEATAAPERESGIPARQFVTYDTHPDRYAHWKLSCDGPVASLKMDVDENLGYGPGTSSSSIPTIWVSTSSSTTPCSAFASSIPR